MTQCFWTVELRWAIARLLSEGFRITLGGILLLVHAARTSRVLPGRVLAGAMLAGWGLFNFVEGILDHLVLGLHHVRPGDTQLAWDLGFVGIGGVGLVAAGYLLARGGTGSPLPGAAASSMLPS